MAGVSLEKKVSGTYTAVGISNIEGLLLVNPKGQSGFAFTLSGEISASGAGFSAGGRLGIVVNTSAANLSGPTNAVTVDVNGTQVTIDAAANSVTVTATDVSFDFGGLLEIRGNFAFNGDGFHGTNLTVFVGKGPSTSPGAIGLLITNATVDVHKFSDNTFVLKVSGSVALLGLDGLRISGAVDFRINTSTTDCSGTAPATGTDPCGGVRQVSQGFTLQVNNLHLGVPGTLDVSGTLVVSRQPNGTLDLAIANANVMVGVGGQTVVQLSGYAGFSISPVTGFRLSGFKVSDFALFPSLPAAQLAAFRTADYSALPGSSSNPNAPTPTLFPTLDLAGARQRRLRDRHRAGRQPHRLRHRRVPAGAVQRRQPGRPDHHEHQRPAPRVRGLGERLPEHRDDQRARGGARPGEHLRLHPDRLHHARRGQPGGDQVRAGRLHRRQRHRLDGRDRAVLRGHQGPAPAT